jgi:tetratricopeptide (TPR) repeat protein
MEVRRGRRPEALRVYERAARHFPNHPSVLADWARLLALEGDIPAGRRILAHLMSPEHRPPPYAFKYAAALEILDGDISAARDIYSRGVSALLPRLRSGEDGVAVGLVPLIHAWAVCEWRHGDASAARSIFRKAEELATSPCAWIFMWRANYETEMGNVILARHYYARAVSTSRDDPVLWRLWSEMESAIGSEDRAALYAQQATSIQTVQTVSPPKEAPPFARRTTRVGAWAYPPMAPPEERGGEGEGLCVGGEGVDVGLEAGAKAAALRDEATVQGSDVQPDAMMQEKKAAVYAKEAIAEREQEPMHEAVPKQAAANPAAPASEALARVPVAAAGGALQLMRMRVRMRMRMRKVRRVRAPLVAASKPGARRATAVLK